MKLKQVTQDCIARICAEAYYGQNRTTLEAVILTVLKEQDAATRHACAEAVSALPFEEECLISSSRAHAACMNTQAI